MAGKLNITGATLADMPVYAAALNRIFGEYGEHLEWDAESMSWWGKTFWNDTELGWTTYRNGVLEGLGLVYCKQAMVAGRPMKLLVGAPSGVIRSIRGAGHAVFTTTSMADAGRELGCDAFVLLTDPRYPATRFYKRIGCKRFLVRQPRGRGLDAAMISRVLIGRPWLSPILAPATSVRPPHLTPDFNLRPYQPSDRAAVRALIERKTAGFDYRELADEDLWVRIYEQCPPELAPIAWILEHDGGLAGYAYAIQRRIVMRRQGEEMRLNTLIISDLFWENGYEFQVKELLGQVLTVGKAQGAHAAFHMLGDHLPRSLQVAHGFTMFSNPPLWMMFKPLTPDAEASFANIRTFHELIPYP